MSINYRIRYIFKLKIHRFPIIDSNWIANGKVCIATLNYCNLILYATLILNDKKTQNRYFYRLILINQSSEIFNFWPIKKGFNNICHKQYFVDKQSKKSIVLSIDDIILQ